MTRKLARLPALPAELLSGMCNVSRKNLTEFCDSNVTFLWGNTLEQLNPCQLTWDPRLLEATVATCVSQLYLPPTTLSAASLLQASSDERNRYYARNTTEEWWNEYTRVPPFDRVDLSRVSLAAYYTYDGCAPCGECSRLLVDSRTYAQAATTPALPSRLARLNPALIRILPSKTDWALDAFQLRNTQMEMVVSVTVTFDLVAYPLSTQQNLSRTGGLTVCLTTLQDVGLAQLNSAAWLSGCIVRVAIKPQLNIPMIRESVVVNPLEQAADGWQVLLFHNESVAVTVDAYAQLYTAATACSDKQDGNAFSIQPTHANNLSGTNVASLSSDSSSQCQAKQTTYCDASYSSGRQLDLCRVCGGACFAPNCTAAMCPRAGQTGIAAVRFTAEFSQAGGIVNRSFNFVEPVVVSAACAVVSMVGVDCRPIGCNRLSLCSGRMESYRVDTRGATVMAGSDFTFSAGQLVYDSPSPRQNLQLTISLFRPSLLQEFPDGYLDREIGQLLLPPIFSANRSNHTRYNASNYTIVNNVSIASVSQTRIQLVGYGEDIFPLLEGLVYRPAATSTVGTNLSTWLVGLAFELRIISPTGAPFSLASGMPSPYIAVCSPIDGCTCNYGFGGPACDLMPNTKKIVFTVHPVDAGRRIIPSSPSSPGRRGVINRGGHGTHVATSLVGVATPGPADGESTKAQLLEIKSNEAISNGAQLAFIDIGTDASPYLTPPESLGDALFSRAYSEAGARVFVAPWNCDAWQWWVEANSTSTVKNRSTTGNRSTSASSDEMLNDDSGSVASNYNLSMQSSLCNRYSSSSWEVDEFVERNPDLLVIFPAGDNGDLGSNTISSPGTCKNCLTVGTSQLWASSLQDASRYLLGSCLPDDCPQVNDQTVSCGGTNSTSAYLVPDCCVAKYNEDTFQPETLHFNSGRGLAVSMQSAQAMYGEMQNLKFGRYKPEVVAPGTLTISGRSDGDPNSGGTHGCRCCAAGAPNDASCLLALTGSSMAAAQVGAAAVLSRQYFTDGWYPAGYPSTSGFSPSSALLRALLVSSVAPVLSAARSDGSWEDISNLQTPNLYAGFGLTTLTNTLRLAVPFNDVCSCSGSNKGLFTSDSDPNLKLLGSDFGTYCAPWSFMNDGRAQCDTMFLDSPYSRPVPSGFNASVLGISCCFSWCFVDPSCTVAGSGTTNWTSFPGLTYSFATCQNKPSTLQSCPWGDSTRNYDVRTIVKDHSIVDTASDISSGAKLTWEITTTSVRLVPNSFPVSAAIAQNETFSYNATIYGASTSVPLVVTLAYTDPTGSLGSGLVLVNNLDLKVLVTPLGGHLAPNATSVQAALLPRLYNQTSLHWGNGVSGGDVLNNVEQLRITVAGPSQVIISVVANRVIQGLGSGHACQPFSLVWTGQLVDFPLPPIVSSVPIDLIAGVCGRPPPQGVQASTGLSTTVLSLIIAGSIVGAAVLLVGCYFLQRARRKVIQTAGDNKARPDQMGYLTSLMQVLREEGDARGGAWDHILLSFDSSPEDDFYRGLPIAIVSGAGAGEVCYR